MNTFGEKLSDYIKQVDCNYAYLSEKTGLSASAISRYCAGMRVPKFEGDAVEKLARGIANIAMEKNLNLSYEKMKEDLESTLNHSSYKDFSQHFGMLVSTLGISLAELSKNINYDASYLSRIRSGQRLPSNIDNFVEETCHYIARKYGDEESLLKMAELLETPMDELVDPAKYYAVLTGWFGAELSATDRQTDDFLKKLDEFDLIEFIRSIHFDELKVPTVPFSLPTTKNYYGVEQMRQGELDFFKTTVLSRHKEPIFMCSDMPMEDMAEDVDFGKKWMFAIAMCIKKGLHLNIIHNIDRPFQEMMLGLESWIPIYMTGQVSPYHLKDVKTNVYHHLNYVSGAAALCGECIKGAHNEGKYYLTNNKEEIAYYRKKSDKLLGYAHPLMQIYRDTEEKEFESLLEDMAKEEGVRRNILSSLPLATMDEELLKKILKRGNLSNAEIKKVLVYAEKQRTARELILKDYLFVDEVKEISKEEFTSRPMLLALSGTFIEKEIPYTYEEYIEHLEQCKKYAESHENYTLSISRTQTFRNIQIHILENKWVLISKSKAPVVHFLIKHPKMVHALQNFIAPVVEEE